MTPAIRRGQGDVRHGSLFKDMHKNPNEHVATCMGPNSPNWQLVCPNPPIWVHPTPQFGSHPTPHLGGPPNCRGPCNATPSALNACIPSQAACHSGAMRLGPVPRLPAWLLTRRHSLASLRRLLRARQVRRFSTAPSRRSSSQPARSCL